jgi:anti-anti-sigma factor
MLPGFRPAHPVSDEAPMKLQSAGDDGQLIRLQVDGQITQRDFSPGGDPLADLLGPDVYTRQVLIDLSKAPMVDSSGIGWLIASHKRFREKGGRVVVHSYQPLVANTLKLLKMDRVLVLAGSLRDAEALVREPREANA